VKLLLVAAAALIDPDCRVLIAQRPQGKSFAGLWEFPGGKVELDERPEAGLIRELREELGIAVEEACLAPLTFASFAYEDFHLSHAALYMPALDRFCRAARKPGAEMGAATGSPRLSDAAGRRALDPGAPRSFWLTAIEYRRRNSPGDPHAALRPSTSLPSRMRGRRSHHRLPTASEWREPPSAGTLSRSAITAISPRRACDPIRLL